MAPFAAGAPEAAVHVFNFASPPHPLLQNFNDASATYSLLSEPAAAQSYTQQQQQTTSTTLYGMQLQQQQQFVGQALSSYAGFQAQQQQQVLLQPQSGLQRGYGGSGLCLYELGGRGLGCGGNRGSSNGSWAGGADLVNTFLV